MAHTALPCLPSSKEDKIMAGKIFVVSGPSAAGKTTVVEEALKRLSKDMEISRVVTYTSRPPRENEIDGKDYVFISGQEFDQKEKEGFFLETAEYAGHRYGSPIVPQEDLELGKSFLYVVELEGAKSIKKLFRDAFFIWIEPPDMIILKARLKKRGTESQPDFEKRVARAEKEIKEAHKIRLFDYVLVNDLFERAVEEFVLLVKRYANESLAAEA